MAWRCCGGRTRSIPRLPVIMITAFATHRVRGGGREGGRLRLPAQDLLGRSAPRGGGARRYVTASLQVENRNLRAQLQQTLGLDNVIGRSPAMTQVFELVKKAARSEANILVLGESGTGKELIARAIHANSPRAGRAFVPVDCASLPEQLLESELFGHEKGAFTGADRTKPGLIEVAHRGTLFLDEIGGAAVAASGQAAARVAGAADPARGRHRRWSTWTCASSRPRTATSATPSRRASSARSSTTAST